MAEKIWFITGTSRGFGREWTIAALERGDKVAATARDTVDARRPGRQVRRRAAAASQLDVTDREADFAAVKQAHDHFGRLDVVVNNAGYGQFGFIEELTEAEARDQIETNVFGALWITQAALPFLRAQRSGHIVQVSSIGGITAFQNVGIYHASKWALEGFSQALAQEVESFGIHVTLIEPGGFSTDWAGPSSKRADRAAGLRRGARGGQPQARASGCRRRAIRTASATAILKVVDAEHPPLRVFFGELPLADGQGRLREPHQDVGGMAAGRRVGAGLKFPSPSSRKVPSIHAIEGTLRLLAHGSSGGLDAAGAQHLVVVAEQLLADGGPGAGSARCAGPRPSSAAARRAGGRRRRRAWPRTRRRQAAVRCASASPGLAGRRHPARSTGTPDAIASCTAWQNVSCSPGWTNTSMLA